MEAAFILILNGPVPNLHVGEMNVNFSRGWQVGTEGNRFRGIRSHLKGVCNVSQRPHDFFIAPKNDNGNHSLLFYFI
jgi:hypothetical protein